MIKQHSFWVLLAALLLDLAIGDPQWRWHPVRLLGGLCALLERGLRRIGLGGRIGGLLHLLLMLALPLLLWGALHVALALWSPWAAFAWDALVASSLLCLRDLLGHVGAVGRAADAVEARRRVSWLVGRDVERLDEDGCARAAIESLAENLVDGVLTPLAGLALAGVPGLLAVKVVSTLDSMIGYRDARYRRFGMWAARADDLLNWLPARLAPLLLALAAMILRAAPLQALRAAWRWHGLLPSPNSGWPEAAMAGALRRRLLGPIHRNGVLVSSVWMGAEDWPAAGRADMPMALRLGACAALLWAGGMLALVWIWPWADRLLRGMAPVAG